MASTHGTSSVRNASCAGSTPNWPLASAARTPATRASSTMPSGTRISRSRLTLAPRRLSPPCTVALRPPSSNLPPRIACAPGQRFRQRHVLPLDAGERLRHEQRLGQEPLQPPCTPHRLLVVGRQFLHPQHGDGGFLEDIISRCNCRPTTSKRCGVHERLLTQPLFVTEAFTGIKGGASLAATLAGAQAILGGQVRRGGRRATVHGGVN